MGETNLLQRTCASSEACWSWQIPRHRAGAGPMPSSLKLPASGHTPTQHTSKPCLIARGHGTGMAPRILYCPSPPAPRTACRLPLLGQRDDGASTGAGELWGSDLTPHAGFPGTPPWPSRPTRTYGARGKALSFAMPDCLSQHPPHERIHVHVPPFTTSIVS